MAHEQTQPAPSTDGPLIANPWLRWGVMVGVYTLITLFFYSQTLVIRSTRDQPIDWFGLFLHELNYWYLWAVFTPFILWVARRYRIERATWRRGIAAHLLLVLFLGPAHDVLWRLFSPWLAFGVPLPEAFERLSWPRILVGSFTAFYKYWLIIGIYYTFDYYRKYRLKEQAAAHLQVKTSELQTQLAQAQLSALKMQLHPHFLFNTLNTISLLMDENVAKANRMLLRLGDLLRLTLENPGVQTVPLRQELAFLQHYLEIEQIRFEDRLQVDVMVSPEALDAAVPNLILQPLVENAIRHGIARKAAAGHLTIRGYRHKTDLIIEIQDDGPGLPAEEPINQGIGLTNTEARLKQRYGDAHRFELLPADHGGAIARMTIPFEDAAPEAPGEDEAQTP